MTHVGTIIIPGRPVSLNAERSASRHERARNARNARQIAQYAWREGWLAHKLPKSLDRIAITVHVTAKDRRWHSDLANCLPTAKAAIDGLVDFGLIPDDTDRHLVRLTFEPTEITGRDALVLQVHDLGELQA